MKLLATLATLLIISAALACGEGTETPGIQEQTPTLPFAVTADPAAAAPQETLGPEWMQEWGEWWETLSDSEKTEVWNQEMQYLRFEAEGKGKDCEASMEEATTAAQRYFEILDMPTGFASKRVADARNLLMSPECQQTSKGDTGQPEDREAKAIPVTSPPSPQTDPALARQLNDYAASLEVLPDAVMACAEGLTLDSPTTTWEQAVADNIECIKNKLEVN